MQWLYDNQIELYGDVEKILALFAARMGQGSGDLCSVVDYAAYSYQS
jgi:hypothetical protein